MVKGILIIVIGIIIIIGGFHYLRGMVKYQGQITIIEKQKYLNAYLENATIFEKGKRYRLVGGKDVEFHVYDDNKIVLEFTVDDITITRIGCIANLDTSTMIH